jgi:GR25 family glycosyltransferase involved in LPS biosynthesis
MNIQYYLIHGIDKSRGPRMVEEFNKWNLDNSKVKWILEPNKDKINDEFREKVLINIPSYTCRNYTLANCPNIKNGQIACTYKHYLCLKDIVENSYDYGVIMEDNQFFCKDIPKHVNLYIEQLNNMYPD